MIETPHLQVLLATFAGWVGRRQSQAIAYLVEENRVLKEQLTSSGRRLGFTDDQRRRLAAKGKPLGRSVYFRVNAVERGLFNGTPRRFPSEPNTRCRQNPEES